MSFAYYFLYIHKRINILKEVQCCAEEIFNPGNHPNGSVLAYGMREWSAGELR
jgi:hypothetical protein